MILFNYREPSVTLWQEWSNLPLTPPSKSTLNTRRGNLTKEKTT